jgi:hypothetical protein
MRQLVRGSTLLLAAVVVVVLAAGASSARKVATLKASTGALETGVGFVSFGNTTDNATELEHMAKAGAKYVTLRLAWSIIAPSGSTAPAGFNPRDPADPNYNWAGVDAEVKAITSAGLKPILVFSSAPTWAESPGSSYAPGTYKPIPSALADFYTAAATRYSGSFENLPRVQYWSVWNEPNLGAYLNPQMVKGKEYSPGWYRSMLNASADAIHAVHADNVVIAGETSPFGVIIANSRSSPPLVFMEKVLCISEKKVVNKRTKAVTYTYQSACKNKAKFDVWSHHPYSQSGPTWKAQVHGDASLGDMDTMRQVLNAAIKAQHVVSSRSVRLWVTEFSWDSKPPDPKAVPISMETRWVSEAMYRLWSSGVSLLTWFILDDYPLESYYWQSGLYYDSPDGPSFDKPKPILRAFRFPFVVLKQTVNGKTTMLLWGRTPTSEPGSVIVEGQSGSKWKRVKTLNANRYGIFQIRIALPARTSSFRARLANGSDQSAAFAVAGPKRPWKGCVWGTC